jgi:hypothetical protein
MLSKLTSASAPTATLAAVFSIFANRIMPFRFLPAEDVSATAPGDMLIFINGVAPIYGVQSLYFLNDALLARTKLKPCHLQWLRAALLCRNYEFLDKFR